MGVLINFKICDNAPECGGIKTCSTGAIYWDEKKKICIDNSKCILCGKCEEACPVCAIRIARNEKEFERLKKEIKEDTRTSADLFVDRYGAMPVGPDFLITSLSSFENSDKIAVVELFNEKSLRCLLKSIPVEDLFEELNLRYGKLELKDNSLVKRFSIKELPCFLFFKKGKLLGIIEGYFEKDEKEKLKEKIDKILKDA